MRKSADIPAGAADVEVHSDSLHGILAFLELSFEAVGFRIKTNFAGAGEEVNLVPLIVVGLSLDP